jgi:surface polysaccharide O-acyltransferase-like enzyme
LRIYYIDAIKVAAIFAVVLIHTFANTLYSSSSDEMLFAHANLLDSLSRFCVPVFFMASGAVLLSRDYDISQFYKRRLFRIIPVLIFWSLIYLIVRIVVKGEEIGVLQSIMMFFDGQIYYHLWFLYVIVTLYLLSPFMRRLIISMNGVEAKILFALWFTLAIAVPHIEVVFELKFGFAYRELGAYSGYFMLGYYLSRIEFKRPIFFLFLFLFSSSAIFYLTGYFSLQKGEFFAAFYDYATPLVFLQAVTMFAIFKSFETAKPLEYAAKLSPLVLGVYLIHPLILEQLNFIDDLTLKAVFVFILSLVAVRTLHLLGLKKIV